MVKTTKTPYQDSYLSAPLQTKDELRREIAEAMERFKGEIEYLPSDNMSLTIEDFGGMSWLARHHKEMGIRKKRETKKGKKNNG